MIRLYQCFLSACLIGAAVSAYGQAPESADESVGAGATEEVIVRGSSPAFLRQQIEMAEDAIFDRFNEINSSDEFDIRCRPETRTGTRIPQRVCQPNFWRDALSRAGEENARAMQGSAALNPAYFLSEGRAKSLLLEKELTRLVAEDAQLLQAFARLRNLESTLEDSRNREPASNATISRVVTAEHEELPYGAALMAEVRVKSEPWSHILAHETFAIAHVFGEIDAVKLSCRDQAQALDFEPGMEWNVPLEWEPCSVTVTAGRGTTFSLYEFD